MDILVYNYVSHFEMLPITLVLFFPNFLSSSCVSVIMSLYYATSANNRIPP